MKQFGILMVSGLLFCLSCRDYDEREYERWEDRVEDVELQEEQPEEQAPHGVDTVRPERRMHDNPRD